MLRNLGEVRNLVQDDAHVDRGEMCAHRDGGPRQKRIAEECFYLEQRNKRIF